MNVPLLHAEARSSLVVGLAARSFLRGARQLILCASIPMWAPLPATAQPVPPPAPATCAPRPIVYIGDRDFPPYEYLNDRGQPAGFNVELIEALSRDLGVPIEIRLMPWDAARRARESGTADLFSAGYVPTRAEQFDFLAATTTVRSSLLMAPGRSSYPTATTGVRGLRIAVQLGAPSLETFNLANEQPTVVQTPSHRDSVALLQAGVVDAAGGSGATLKWHAARLGLAEPVEIHINARDYMLATRKGCGEAMAALTDGVDRLKEQGVIDAIAARTLAIEPVTPWNWRPTVFWMLLGAALLGLGAGWTWTLRRQVRARTAALSEAFLEQKRLADLIRSNEGRLGFAMDVIGEGVWEWDLQTGKIEASTRWAGSFGYRPDEAPTTYETWMSYVHPDDRDRVTRAAQAHIEGRAPRFESTYRIPLKGGDWVWVLDRGRIVLRDDNGKPLRMVGALKDITVQLAAEQALHEAKDAAESTSRAKTTFLATISHEIRTPLNAIIGAAGLIDTKNLTVDQQELIGLVQRGGDTLLAIVDDVLDFTKIEAGRVDLDVRPFEIARLVRESIQLVEQAAFSKGLSIAATIDDNVPAWVRGDDLRLRQILLNLLSNAVKFTAAGEVNVRVSAESLTDTDVGLCFAVRDTGIGMPQDRLDRLFQPFSQVDSSTTRRFGGTGLGLAISRKLAELMSGTLEVETTQGRGSVFSLHVRLPREESPTESSAATGATADVRQPLRVVLAEDNPVNQLVQSRMLADLGNPPDIVSNGRQLLEAAERTHYDVGIVDVQMPEMDGLEAARELRVRGFRQLWLIALTADVTTETKAACMAAGFDAYLSKPVKKETLRDALLRARAHLESLVTPDV
jgi:PAS domain S-box-containing protein